MNLTLPPAPDSPRVAFFGIDCHLTLCVLDGIINKGVNIAGMVLPGLPGVDLPVSVHPAKTTIPLANAVATHSGVVDTLRRHHIPAFRIGNLRSQQAANTLLSFNANVLMCVCFPSAIPRALTKLFPERAINVHPSLLPDKRGPDPLFWTLREGTGRSGVTIHELSPRFDAGAILSQRTHTYFDGTTERELESSLASLAVEMALDVLPRLVLGDVQAHQQLEPLATYARWPQSADFRLNFTMSARAAFNFVRGIQGRGIPIPIEYRGVDVTVVEAMRVVDRPTGVEDDVVALEFSDGYLLARVQPGAE